MAAQPHTKLIEVVTIVAQSVGHPVPADVASSADAAIIRMGYYANEAGTELAEMNKWQETQKRTELSIVAVTPGSDEEGFDLPTDFGSFTDDTQWDRSSQLPAIGPVNPQDWQWLVVREAMITTRFMWRIRLGQLWIKSPPSVATPFSFEYQSKNWARDADTDAEIDYMVKNGDYHVYPWHLVVLLTRLKWLANEGYDTAQAQKDFDKALASKSGSNLGATALSLVPGVGYPYLSPDRNLPDTGYGSI